MASQRQEAPPYVVAKQAGLAGIEPQLDGGGNLVHVLAARTGSANKGLCQFGIWNEDRQMLFSE